MGTWARATLLCGTLDIVYAMLVFGPAQDGALGVLHSVAAGPFGAGMREGGVVTAALGLAVHFAIMAVMTASFLFLYRRIATLRRLHPALAGTAYGTILYVAMYVIVLGLRYPSIFPQTEPQQIALALLPHIALVGIPLAYLARHANADARRSS